MTIPGYAQRQYWIFEWYLGGWPRRRRRYSRQVQAHILLFDRLDSRRRRCHGTCWLGILMREASCRCLEKGALGRDSAGGRVGKVVRLAVVGHNEVEVGGRAATRSKDARSAHWPVHPGCCGGSMLGGVATGEVVPRTSVSAGGCSYRACREGACMASRGRRGSYRGVTTDGSAFPVRL